jgi:phospholipid-binding lipoprotein MlaA
LAFSRFAIVLCKKELYSFRTGMKWLFKPSYCVGKSKGEQILTVQNLGSRQAGIVVAFAALMVLVGCSAPSPGTEINDPFEARNREIHAMNVSADRWVIRPASEAYDAALPSPIQRGVTNFANNLNVPGDMLNNILQGQPQFAMQNALRMGLNSTVGVLGLFDFSTAIGLPGVEADFGQTLHVWGVGEGAFLMLPAIGPSTERDLVGSVVDIVINPVRVVLPFPESILGTASTIGAKLSDRRRFASTIDSIYYDSADSYAQLRLLYLQKRRYELGQTQAESDDAFVDPYEDPYGQ